MLVITKSLELSISGIPSRLRHAEELVVKGVPLYVSHLNFIVLEENVGFKVIDGLIDYICVFGCRGETTNLVHRRNMISYIRG